MNCGYIKFWRKAQDSSSWNRGLMYQGLIINLLVRAAWKKGSYQGRDILPGQFGAVLGQLADSLSVPKTTLHRMVSHLAEDGFLTVSNMGNRFTIITITNWHLYQEHESAARNAGGTPVEHQRNAGGTPLYNEEEVKKEEDINTASASPAAELSPPVLPAVQDKVEADTQTLPAVPAVPIGAKRRKASAAPPPDEPYYRTQSGRYLTGKRLEAFEQRFWPDFALPKGKAEAADAWLDIPQLSDAFVAHICYAARCEAAARPEQEAKRQTPKWAQGWINARRWEDYEPQVPVAQARAAPEPENKSQSEIEQERIKVLAGLDEWRKRRMAS